MTLTTQQQHVLEQIKEFLKNDSSVFILRGYAGTGKTTMIQHITDYASQIRPTKLMAPTGRAARVLQTKTGRPASTIHRGIYSQVSLSTKKVKNIFESEFKLCFPINLISERIVAIVDEASMICSLKQEQELLTFGTNNLLDDLLTFVRPSFGGKVIFVGDPIQLPPVGESVSNALNVDYFIQKGLKVQQTELTEVLRQKGDSVILKNAMQIRNILQEEKHNRLVFDEKKDEVVSLSPNKLLDKYMETSRQSQQDDHILICHSNRLAAEYNKRIRRELYGTEDPELQVGDLLQVVQNNYRIDKMNGDFVSVMSVGEKIRRSAPVYIQEGGKKVKKNITLEFIHIQIPDAKNNPIDCLLQLDLLNNGKPSLGIDEQRALFIDFRIRNQELKPQTKAFTDALMNDMYFNCLKAKYGYAITGHKSQGGEWKKVFIDYDGRTGLNDECLRWIYTTTTRAQEQLYFTNLPHITPFSKFRFEPVHQCSKINEECRITGRNVELSPFHDASAPNYLHAKWMCIKSNMEETPYEINRVESKPYQEIYYISTPDGIERYDIRYKKGGIFLKAEPQKASSHSVMVSMLLNNERSFPFIFNYAPSNEIHEKLYNLIRSACDGLNIPITNVVEHKEDYSVVFYFYTSDCLSYIKIYINDSGFVTYAKPMSLLGKKDKELIILIEEIQHHFE